MPYIPDRNFDYALSTNFLNDECHPDLYPSDSLDLNFLDIGFRGIKDITGIEYFRNLEVLCCGGNEFTELELLDFPKLKFLHCYNGKLEKLDLSGCPNLIELVCFGNNLTELDISCCLNLNFVYCGFNVLTSLDATANKEIKHLDAKHNFLSSLRISGNIDERDVVYDDNPNLDIFEIVY